MVIFHLRKDVCWDGVSIDIIQMFCRLDYEKTKQANQDFCRELVEYVFNPERMIRQAGDIPLWEYMEYY